MPAPLVETERLRLRPFNTHDLDALAAIYADPDVMRYMTTGKPAPRERVQVALDWIIDYWRSHSFGIWAVEEKATGKLLGQCGLFHLDGTPEIEVAYLLAKEAWGRGYATEAAKAALLYAFDDLELGRVVAVTRPENVASQHVLAKCGLRYERDAHYYNLDVRYFSVELEGYEGGNDA